MTEQDLRSLLLDYETANASVRTVGRSAGGHGTWMVRILTAITALFWIVALTLLGAFFVGTFDWLTHHVRRNLAPTDNDVQGALLFMAVVAAAVFAAVLSSLIRAYASRVSRLRRINAGLFEILSQLLQHKRSEKGAE